MKNVSALLQDKPIQTHALTSKASVFDAIKLMAEQQIGSVIILDGEHISGIVTERDYARKVILQGRSSIDTLVSEIMSSPVLTVRASDTVSHCMNLMTERKIRHLPVQENGVIIGLISIGDLVKAVIEQQQEEISQLQQYIAS
jgi:signal-transduction protein with cAMP-binding, CBS, and nucleotidyltransferase domain